VAKIIYNDLNTLRDQVKAKIEALLATSSTQTEKVHTLIKQISTALTKQWEDLTKVIKSETTTIVDGAKERFDQVNEELIKLYNWTKKSIDHEVQDQITSYKAIGEIAIAAVAEIKSLKRKQKESPAPLGTASTKRQRQHQPNITLDLRETSEPPPPPQNQKEPWNIPQPDKFDGSSTKLKPFLNDVANIFECMPITYRSANDKILYVAALLTGSTKQWYLANETRRKPDPQSGWCVRARYEDFLKDFISVHKNRNEVREAKRNIQMEFQKAGELIKDYVSRMHTLNMVANLPRDLLWEYLVTGLQPEVREYMKRTNKDSLDVAPASPEMYVEAITGTGMEVENERIREQYMRNAQKLKEQTQAAARGKKPDQKPQADGKLEAPKPSGVKKKKSKQGENKKSSVSSEKSKTSEKKAKEPGEEKVTYSMRQARMKEGQCIKYGSKDYIKKDSTAG